MTHEQIRALVAKGKGCNQVALESLAAMILGADQDVSPYESAKEEIELYDEPEEDDS
jgi:hypothetical protein